MDLNELYEKFPDENDLIRLIEEVFWRKQPTCPYCESKNYSQRKINNGKYKTFRYHCNNCNTDYTVLVNTIFQNTKLQLHKWILALMVVIDSNGLISVRNLAKKLNVSKDTALRMRTLILKSIIEKNFVKKIENIKRRINNDRKKQNTQSLI